MEKTERIDLFKTAINTWGVEAQTKMLFEEIGELLSALGKFDRNRVSSDDVITEIADVSIMVEQMATLFGYEDFEKEKERKLQRLKEKLGKYECKGIDRAVKTV